MFLEILQRDGASHLFLLVLVSKSVPHSYCSACLQLGLINLFDENVQLFTIALFQEPVFVGAESAGETLSPLFYKTLGYSNVPFDRQ